MKCAPLYRLYFPVLHFLFLYLSALKSLHPDKHILSAAECAECARQGWLWYKRAAIVIADKPPHDVQRTLDIIREQSEMAKDSYHLEELTRLLKGKNNSSGIDTYNKVINGVVTACKWVLEFQPCQQPLHCAMCPVSMPLTSSDAEWCAHTSILVFE